MQRDIIMIPEQRNFRLDLTRVKGKTDLFQMWSISSH